MEKLFLFCQTPRQTELLLQIFPLFLFPLSFLSMTYLWHQLCLSNKNRPQGAWKGRRRRQQPTLLRQTFSAKKTVIPPAAAVRTTLRGWTTGTITRSLSLSRASCAAYGRTSTSGRVVKLLPQREYWCLRGFSSRYIRNSDRRQLWSRMRWWLHGGDAGCCWKWMIAATTTVTEIILLRAGVCYSFANASVV